MDAPIYGFYPTRETIFVLFDLRIPGAVDRLHSERAAWQEKGIIEALDEHHFVLVIRPGGARSLVP